MPLTVRAPLMLLQQEVGRMCTTSAKYASSCLLPAGGRRPAWRVPPAVRTGVDASTSSPITAPNDSRICSTIVSRQSSSSECSTSSECSPQQSGVGRDLAFELGVLLAMLPGGPAAAEEAITYNSAAGDGIVKAFSGILYLGLLGFFLYRTFNRRARQAREEVSAACNC